MKYHKTKVIERDSFDWKIYTNSDPCRPDYLCQYFLDANNTVEPLTWYEQLKDVTDKMQGNQDTVDRLRKSRAQRILKADFTVVHVTFASTTVEMNVLDTRYTLNDRIAKLGGTLGLCTQITGATFLTVIHLLVLIIKACFNCWFKHRRRDVSRGAGGTMAPPDFGRSVNSISTRRSRFCPPQ